MKSKKTFMPKQDATKYYDTLIRSGLVISEDVASLCGIIGMYSGIGTCVDHIGDLDIEVSATLENVSDVIRERLEKIREDTLDMERKL